MPVLKVQFKLATLARAVNGLFIPLMVTLKAVLVGKESSKITAKVNPFAPPTATVELADTLEVAVTVGLEKVNGGLWLTLGKIIWTTLPVARAVALVMLNVQPVLLWPIKLSVPAAAGATEAPLKEPAMADCGKASQRAAQKGSAKIAP